MYNECRHILPSGKKCQSPALQDWAFCFYHDKLSRQLTSHGLTPPADFRIEDLRGIQLALGQVLTYLNSPTADIRRARLQLYGLQIATQVAKQLQALKPAETVRTCVEADGLSLAPDKSVCEIEDCRKCPRRRKCPDCPPDVLWQEQLEAEGEWEEDDESEFEADEKTGREKAAAQSPPDQGTLDATATVSTPAITNANATAAEPGTNLIRNQRTQPPEEDPNAEYRRKDDAMMMRGAIRLFQKARDYVPKKLRTDS